MSTHRDDDPTRPQEPEEVEVTDNSSGAAVDSNRLDELEEETLDTEQ